MTGQSRYGTLKMVILSGIWKDIFVDKTVKVCNPETGALIKTLEGHDDFVTSGAFSKNNLLASVSDDNTIKI